MFLLLLLLLLVTYMGHREKKTIISHSTLLRVYVHIQQKTRFPRQKDRNRQTQWERPKYINLLIYSSFQNEFTSGT